MEVLRFPQKLETLEIVSTQKLKHVKNMEIETINLKKLKLS